MHTFRKITLALFCLLTLSAYATDDKVVPLDYSKRAQQTYSNAVLKIIDKAGHGFSAILLFIDNKN